ncbi:MAG TPA: PP2C family protein-serine/threonine phosphatase [Bryobacteraceae bacterium]|nr:PP2C family protein-serine/threonine phosphatase [Bryobacteraceae bacterium]
MPFERPPDITAPAFWHSLNKWDSVLLGLFAVCLLAGFGLPGITLPAVLRLSAYGLGCGLCIRLIRRFLRQIIWRLRNRLLVAYAFIAVVPVVLVTTLSAMFLYATLGQMAIYMVTSELERRTALIISTVEHLAEDTAPAIGPAYPILASRLPGLEVYIESGGKTTRFPEGSAISSPAADWGDAGGLLVKDGLLYAWAHIVRPESRVTGMLPLTSQFLASLAPNIGEVQFYRMDEDPRQPQRRLRLHRSTGDAFHPEAPRNRLPDPENRFDVEVRWAIALPAFLWESPGRVENELMRIRTRPFAVLQAVFAQKVDAWLDLWVPVAIVFSAFFFLAEIVSLFIGISITRTITGAVHDLYEGTERIREGIFSHRIHIKGRDQLAELGESFNSMTAHIERLLLIAKENERIQADLEIAREVQNQLYPRVMPDFKSLRLKALCNPARMVSGDYYDCQQLDHARMAVAMGDVAGKGISAALLMATVQSALRTQIRHCLETPEEISTSTLVSHLNKHLYAHTTPEKYATFCLGIYNEADTSLTYTNAGHLPPILIRDGMPQLLDVNGTVVGAFPFSRYEESRITLHPGDLLLFYTDGITEAENAYGEQFGEDKLCDILRRNHDCPPAQILTAIISQVSDWTGSGEMQDDMTLLLAQRV